jgi:uncharacterized protein YndB with AHSA1/START domain
MFNMFEQTLHPASLELRYIFDAPRERVFRAWTEPGMLKQWFRAAPNYTTPIAEVDLRVGGRYRFGMKPPESEQVLVATGVYRLIQPPEKLVFTWTWEGAGAPETLVTVEFRQKGRQTEITLTHKNFQDPAERDQHNQGWQGCLTQLAAWLVKMEV